MAATVKPEETQKPEEHIKEEALHKASTDLTERDIADVPPDLWFVECGALIRADSEEAARNKVAALYGIHADVKDLKSRRPKKAELD